MTSKRTQTIAVYRRSVKLLGAGGGNGTPAAFATAWGTTHASRSVDEFDLGPLVDHLRQRSRVPIGEADASVRVGLVDILRRRGAMDAVVIAEIDPGGANRIVGTGSDGERLVCLHPSEMEFGRI